MPRCRILRAGLLLLFACGPINAQQSSPTHLRTKPKDTSSASTSDSDLTPPQFLFPLPNELSQQPTRATTRVEAELIHATSSTELNAFLKDSILPLIRANWYQLISGSMEKVGGDATV